MHVAKATKEFEGWLSRHISVVPHQLSAKHKLMAEDPIPFLRGTFYRWAQLFPKVCSDLAKAEKVLAVGDLHIGSFGTWRDGFGRLIWGVDDFDEAYPLPYTSDLVRLGVSAIIDASEGNIAVSLRNACDVILDGYSAGLTAGGSPLVLEERHKWLRNIALHALDKPAVFWRKIDALPGAQKGVPDEARKALERLLPESGLKYRVVRRVAGVGSLGHSRYVAVAEWHGGQIALEAKEAAPSACAWAKPRAGTRILYQALLDQAVRCPDPFVRLCGKWLVHQIAPDSAPIEIETMNGQKDQDRLLHTMAWEAANVHLGTRRARKVILGDLKKRPGKWLRSAVSDMVQTTIRDWKDWKKAYTRR